jgi:ABC-type phosphate transport system substrate-binding protein
MRSPYRSPSRSEPVARAAALALALSLGAFAAAAEDAETPTPSPSPRPIESLAIVVNTANPVENLSSAELRRIFLAEVGQWPHGRRATVVMREAGEPEREAILKLVYRMSERELDRYFLEKVFRGEIQGGPKLLSTAAGVKRFVVNVPGAIGYVRAGDLDDTVKAVRIEGRAPGEPGYPLMMPLR